MNINNIANYGEVVTSLQLNKLFNPSAHYEQHGVPNILHKEELFTYCKWIDIIGKWTLFIAHCCMGN